MTLARPGLADVVETISVRPQFVKQNRTLPVPLRWRSLGPSLVCQYPPTPHTVSWAWNIVTLRPKPASYYAGDSTPRAKRRTGQMLAMLGGPRVRSPAVNGSADSSRLVDAHGGEGGRSCARPGGGVGGEVFQSCVWGCRELGPVFAARAWAFLHPARVLTPLSFWVEEVRVSPDPTSEEEFSWRRGQRQSKRAGCWEALRKKCRGLRGVNGLAGRSIDALPRKVNSTLAFET